MPHTGANDVRTGQVEQLFKHLRRVVAPGGGEDRSDGQLLEHFLARHDEAAFAALVQRHGSMVLGVCRRVLGNCHDAEDAFQATFLVLVRKAASVGRRELLANWLYGVAHRTALAARAKAGRRRARERQVTEMPEQAAPAEDPWLDAQPILDEELSRLPDKYRSAVVLCDLEGKTRREAARQLRLPEGTLSGRLARARQKLAERLSRRGVTLSGGALAAALAGNAAASVPASLVGTTVKAGTALAAGVIPAKITALAEGVLKAMLLTKLKITVAVLLTVGVVGLALGVAVRQNLAAKPPAPPKERPPAKVENTPETAEAERPRKDRHGDPLPPGVLARIGTIRWRHGGPVSAVAFSPDGKRVASGGLDGTVHVWDAATGEEVRCWVDERSPHRLGGEVRSVAFSSDGKTLAATRSDRPPCLWNVATGKKILEYGGRGEIAQWITFSPDGKAVAYFSFTKSGVVLAEAATGKEVRRFPVKCRVNVLRFSPDGKTLAGACADTAIRLWDVAGKRPSRILQGHKGEVETVCWSADGKELASASGDDTLRLWNVATGKELKSLTVPEDEYAPVRVLFSADGKTLISTHKYSLRFWDRETGKVLREFRAHGYNWMRALALSPDGKVLVSGGNDNTVRLWEVATGKPLSDHPEAGRGLRFVALSPDGRMVATGGSRQKVRLWEADTGKPLSAIDHAGPSVFTPDGQFLITGGWYDGEVRIWDVLTGKEVRHFAVHDDSVPSSREVVGSLALAPDGKTLATSCDGVRLWDLATGRQLRALEETKRGLNQVGFAPGGKTLAVLHFKENGSLVRLYDVATGKPIRDFKGGTIGSFAFSPDGKLLAATDSGAGDGQRLIHLWEVATGKELRRFPGHADPLDSVAFSPDGRTLLWGGQREKVVYVWEVATGQTRAGWYGHQGKVTAVSFSLDGAKAASASEDGTVLIWDVHRPLRRATRKPDGDKVRWADLGAGEAVRAYHAMCHLGRRPTRAVELAREHLRPVPRANKKQVARWLRDLDSDTFTVREQADRELEKLGVAAEPALRETLRGNPPLEVRRRVETLLKKLNGRGRRLRTMRALELLEHLGTAEARRLLEELARGVAGALLTEEAKAAVTRLQRQSAGERR